MSETPGMGRDFDVDDIGGVVTGEEGPEAGVWVIAETGSFDTFFARSVVTNDDGQYVIPDLPGAEYQVWVRGYGLQDSAKTSATPGAEVDISVQTASPAEAAEGYPAAYWYAMMHLPTKEEVQRLDGGMNEYLTWMKNMGCVGCHQLGNEMTRTLPPQFAGIGDHQAAWIRRVQSGQAGRQMINQLTNGLQGIPIRYLADWTERVAAGELPHAKPERPSGQERNVVVTVRDWSSPEAYIHDLSGTDRRDPTVNGHGPIYGAPELSTDNFPILN
ncbi:MAG: carboxypeptidase-like regulatory domain-containing protein, partial [Pseudohongiellaceae bacterium]